MHDPAVLKREQNLLQEPGRDVVPLGQVSVHYRPLAVVRRQILQGTQTIFASFGEFH